MFLHRTPITSAGTFKIFFYDGCFRVVFLYTYSTWYILRMLRVTLQAFHDREKNDFPGSTDGRVSAL